MRTQKLIQDEEGVFKPLPLPRLRTHTHPISDLKMAGVLRGEINPEDPALPLPPADWQNMPLEERLVLVDYVTVKWTQQRASVAGKKWKGGGENGKFSGFTVAPRTLLFLSRVACLTSVVVCTARLIRRPQTRGPLLLQMAAAPPRSVRRDASRRPP